MKFILTTLFFTTLSFFSQAQNKIGLRVSLGSCTAQTEDQFFVNQDKRIEYQFSFKNHKQSKALGIFYQKRIGFIYLQPEFLYRITHIEYELIDFFSDDYSPYNLNETSHFIRLPITAGISIRNNFRLGAGPVFNYLLNSGSEIKGMHSLSSRQSKFSFGYQAGLGYDYHILSIDIKYEFSFSKLAENIYYLGDKRSFSATPNNLIIAFGVAF